MSSDGFSGAACWSGTILRITGLEAMRGHFWLLSGESLGRAVWGGQEQGAFGRVRRWASRLGWWKQKGRLHERGQKEGVCD